MNTDIIGEIEVKYPQKLIQRNCKLINKKCSPKSSKDLGHVTELGILLYIFGMYDDAIKVCDILNEIEFTGNYTLWANVVNARMLKIKILNKMGKEEEIKEILDEVLFHENKILWRNQSGFSEKYDIHINNAMQYNHKREATGWKLIKLELMIRFSGLPDFPLDKLKLEEDIEKLVEELREEIK